MNNQHDKDQMMVAHICQTLDQQCQQAHRFDTQLEILAEQAQQQRQQALANHHRQAKKWWYVGGSLAIAASLMLVVLSPQQLQQVNQVQTQENIVLHVPVEPQLLEDMDMLLALGD